MDRIVALLFVIAIYVSANEQDKRYGDDDGDNMVTYPDRSSDTPSGDDIKSTQQMTPTAKIEQDIWNDLPKTGKHDTIKGAGTKSPIKSKVIKQNKIQVGINIVHKSADTPVDISTNDNMHRNDQNDESRRQSEDERNKRRNAKSSVILPIDRSANLDHGSQTYMHIQNRESGTSQTVTHSAYLVRRTALTSVDGGQIMDYTEKEVPMYKQTSNLQTISNMKDKLPRHKNSIISHENKQAQYYNKCDNMECTIPPLLKYSAHHEDNTIRKHWIQYIFIYPYEHIKYMKIRSFIDAIKSLSVNVTNIVSSLWNTGPALSEHNTCRIGEYITTQPLLYRGHMSMMHFDSNCTLSWDVHVSRACSINITIVTKHWQVMEVNCNRLPTDHSPDPLLMCACLTRLIIIQTEPIKHYVGVFCGHMSPQSAMIAGHAVSIRLANLIQVSNHVAFVIIYQCVERIAQLYQPHYTRYTDTEVERSAEMIPIPATAFRYKHSQTYTLWSVTVDLMHSINMIIVVKMGDSDCVLNNSNDITVIVVDGPMTAFDALSHFNWINIVNDSDRCQPMKITRWQSTLNDATIISSTHAYQHTHYFNLAYQSILCQYNICQQRIEQVVPNTLMRRHTYSVGTHMYNHTFESFGENIALNITSLDVIGYYPMFCSYGSVTLLYRDMVPQVDDTTERFSRLRRHLSLNSEQTILGTYCSPSAVDGIVTFSKPLLLGKGSLSVLVKTYSHVTTIRIRYTVFTHKCQGVVYTHLYEKYWRYVRSLDENMHLMFVEPSFVVSIMVNSFSSGVTIIKKAGECVHYQWVTTDHLKNKYLLFRSDGYRWYRGMQLESLKSITQYHPFKVDISLVVTPMSLHTSNYLLEMGQHVQLHTLTVESNFFDINTPIQKHNIYHSVERLKLMLHPLNLMPALYHFSSIGISLRLAQSDSYIQLNKIPLYLGNCYTFDRLVYSIYLLDLFHEPLKMSECYTNIAKLPMLITNRYWYFTIEQHFRNVIYNIENPSQTIIESISISMGYKVNSYLSTSYVIVNEYRQPLPEQITSLSTRHQTRHVIIESSNPTRWNGSWEMAFHYDKSEPYYGLPRYQAAHWAEVKEPNEWRMCRLGRCYLLRDNWPVPVASTWEEAEEFCLSNNGHLISLNSDTEQTVIFDWLVRRPIDRYQESDIYNTFGYLTLYMRATMIFIGLKASKVSFPATLFEISFVPNAHCNFAGK